MQLAPTPAAVSLLNRSFSEGYWMQAQLHRTTDLEPLWDYPPFRDLMRSKG